MLSTVAGALILVERRRLIQVIPDSFIQFLNEWEVRVLILLSLTLQTLLSTLGNRRKYICKIWIRISLWCAYLLADYVAIVSLGIIAKSTLNGRQKDVNYPLDELKLFWSQFFLLHLGGPDTITAYSLEDNELWLRHLVGLVIQTGLAFYILLVALPGSSWLPVLSILIFVAGLIKYGERLFALFASNSEIFGTLWSRSRIQPALLPALKPEQAFDVVEVELGFVFDELYTKASVVYKAGGIVLRTITLSLTFFALMAFVFLCETSKYKKRDLVITYMLLVVAICLEIYAVWVLINSDWTENWLSRHERTTYSSLIIRWFQRSNKRRWSKKMAQHSLLDLCVRGKSAVRLRNKKFLRKIRKLSWIDNYLEKHWYKTFVNVSPELKDLIFSELARVNEHDSTALNRRGSFTLEKYGNLHLDWTQEVEFDQRILLWHIATDICYSMEWGDNEEPNCTERKLMSDHSKQISDYMLYLLIACPFMLPIGIGMIRFRDTCAEAKEFLEERNVRSCKATACKKLLQVNTEVPPTKVKGDRSKSVLFDACKTAKCLLARKEDRWEIISKVWVEMLAHAATHCGGSHHARQLRKGGELLTHVWLLMAHLGITEHSRYLKVMLEQSL
ncbi:UNVERIFIED_CONTAM: hypothetical protein Sradi_0227900 [Sesamum radiatum]|uniref:DUF4220 domain-containing protein n=1 Tax=Sesamum radiatum TaxID=300843 RepID=A0AAW2W1Z7_SESRA